MYTSYFPTWFSTLTLYNLCLTFKMDHQYNLIATTERLSLNNDLVNKQMKTISFNITKSHQRKWSYNAIIIFSFNFEKKTKIIFILVVNYFCRKIVLVEKLKLELKIQFKLTATVSLIVLLQSQATFLDNKETLPWLNKIQVPFPCGMSQSSSL